MAFCLFLLGDVSIERRFSVNDSAKGNELKSSHP